MADITRKRCWLFALTMTVAVGLHAQNRIQADARPLPANEQAAVNQAIDRGVRYLAATQGALGTWATNKKHMVGYAALPGLTLLECGASPRSPVIQRTALLVRQSVAKLDQTYEISLAILFLDRLGDPRDRPLIQILAARLIAGQTPTGGWSYRCPLLNSTLQREILFVLRKLDPRPHFDPVFLADGKKLPDLVALQTDDKKPSSPGEFQTIEPRRPPLQFPTGVASPKSPGYLAPTESPGSTAQPRPGEPASVGPGQTERHDASRSSRGEPTGDKPTPGEVPGAPTVPKDQKEKEPKANTPVFIPVHLRGLPVFRDPQTLILLDPDKQTQLPVMGTTDNSNTQFATLALWAAQRHQVPMKRSLNLLVYRFRTSQNADGGWGYRYRNGGGATGSQAMTCVGLLGLAIGQGVTHQQDADPKRLAWLRSRDPRLVDGLVALSRFIEQPAGRLKDLPQPNLYFLWSVERVGVLFDLPRIGGKDWYRWAAECLVANQALAGNWTNGSYPGASPVLDTCLALLILKRANLTHDLTARIRPGAEELNRAVEKRIGPVTPPSPSPPPPPEVTTPPPPPQVATTIPMPEEATPVEPRFARTLPESERAGTAVNSLPAVRRPDVASAEEESGNGTTVLIALSSLGGLLLAGCVALILVSGKKPTEEELAD
jgi:hypothetical protein